MYPGAVHMTERALQTWLGAASKVYMLLQDRRSTPINIMRPLTDNAEGDDVPNRDFHTIFSGA